MDALRLDIVVPLRAFDLELALEVGRETVALVGPSGAGKSTALRAIAGLHRPGRGSIRLGETTWFGSAEGIDLPPEERSVGLVFQEYALFPHLSVRKNVEFGGKGRVDELLERFRISQLADERPGAISGGERQRVALARALARDPRVLLLDEPLSALDAHTKSRVRAELHELLESCGLPAIIVTHDFEDAAALADRVGVLAAGRLVQLATPADLVASPADPFVAGLTGANLLRGLARPGAGGLTEVTLSDGARVYSVDEATGEVVAVVYPWEISIARVAAADSALNHVAGEVLSVVAVGNRVRVRIGPLTAEVTASSLERLGLEPGQQAVASFKATGTRLVSAA